MNPIFVEFSVTTLKSSDGQGFRKPLRVMGKVDRVRVKVGILYPPENPYPCQGCVKPLIFTVGFPLEF